MKVINYVVLSCIDTMFYRLPFIISLELGKILKEISSETEMADFRTDLRERSTTNVLSQI
jgi:hypothetical protein